MVTMDRAAMMLWLTPITTVRRDIGSSTLVRVCTLVEPSDSAASTVVAGTERMACAVMRTAGGAA